MPNTFVTPRWVASSLKQYMQLRDLWIKYPFFPEDPVRRAFRLVREQQARLDRHDAETRWAWMLALAGAPILEPKELMTAYFYRARVIAGRPYPVNDDWWLD